MGARMGTARRPGESEEKRRRGGRGETDFPKPGTSQMTHQRQGCSEGSQGHPLNLGHGHVGNEGDVAEMSGLQSPRAQEVGWGCLCRTGTGDTLRVRNKKLGNRAAGTDHAETQS